MGKETTNITGVILEHSVSDEAFKDLIGKCVPAWLDEYGKDVRLVVRENYYGNSVELTVELNYIMLATDGWNQTFEYRAIVRGGPEDRIGHWIDGKIMMTGSGHKFLGLVHAS
jgi:hypothetical protein